MILSEEAFFIFQSKYSTLPNTVTKTNEGLRTVEMVLL